MAWAEAVQAAIQLGGQLVGFFNRNNNNGAEENFQYNLGLQQQQQSWLEHMSNTAHQREMEDLRRAGLNPLLAINKGASTPGAGLNSLGTDISSAKNAKVANKIALMNGIANAAVSASQSRLINAQANKTNAETNILNKGPQGTVAEIVGGIKDKFNTYISSANGYDEIKNDLNKVKDKVNNLINGGVKDITGKNTNIDIASPIKIAKKYFNLMTDNNLNLSQKAYKLYSRIGKYVPQIEIPILATEMGKMIYKNLNDRIQSNAYNNFHNGKLIPFFNKKGKKMGEYYDIDKYIRDKYIKRK